MHREVYSESSEHSSGDDEEQLDSRVVVSSGDGNPQPCEILAYLYDATKVEDSLHNQSLIDNKSRSP